MASYSFLEQMKKIMASAMFTWIMSEKTWETDRKKADTVGRTLQEAQDNEITFS